MTDEQTWSRAADATRRVGREVEFHRRIGSTNDRVREALRDGRDGLAVVADEQTAGRGRRGRAWLSPPGLNLMVSVGVRPRLEPSAAGLLGMAAALAVRDACAEAASAGLLVRWPNDVVTPDRLKVAGLLLETGLSDGRLLDAIIGAGINVNWRRGQMPPEIAGGATSLADLRGSPVDRVALLGSLLARLDAELEALERGRSPVPRVGAASALDGRRVTVDVGGTQLEGTAAGIAEDGALLLDTGVGRLALSVGEVVRVRDALAEAPA